MEKQIDIITLNENMINNNYEGIGTYIKQRKSKYIGNFKNGKYNGFGKLFNSSNDLVYEGFFNNDNYNGKGILYKNGKKIFEGNFKNGKYENIGIEYLPNGKRKRKARYLSGEILNQCYGVLYDKNDKELYKGILRDGIPKEGKSLIFYGDGDYIIYEGDFSSFQYNGNGIIYFKKNDKYIEGTLYYSEGNKKYEEKFNNNALNGEEAIYFEKNDKIFCKGIFNNF